MKTLFAIIASSVLLLVHLPFAVLGGLVCLAVRGFAWGWKKQRQMSIRLIEEDEEVF